MCHICKQFCTFYFLEAEALPCITRPWHQSSWSKLQPKYTKTNCSFKFVTFQDNILKKLIESAQHINSERYKMSFQAKNRLKFLLVTSSITKLILHNQLHLTRRSVFNFLENGTGVDLGRGSESLHSSQRPSLQVHASLHPVEPLWKLEPLAATETWT